MRSGFFLVQKIAILELFQVSKIQPFLHSLFVVLEIACRIAMNVRATNTLICMALGLCNTVKSRVA